MIDEYLGLSILTFYVHVKLVRALRVRKLLVQECMISFLLLSTHYCTVIVLSSLQDHVTSGLASLSAMQSLGGFHMAAAAAAGIPHHQLMASAAAVAAAGGVNPSRDILDHQTELGAGTALGSAGSGGHHQHHHHLNSSATSASLTALGVPHDYHHL